MEKSIEAFLKNDWHLLNKSLNDSLWTKPILYADFIEKDPKIVPKEVAELYWQRPLTRDLRISIEEMDPYHISSIRRNCPLTCLFKGCRWFYSYYNDYKNVFVPPPTHSKESFTVFMIKTMLGFPSTPVTGEETLIKQLWIDQGSPKHLIAPLIPTPVFFYFLFYFRDVLPHAESTLKLLFKSTLYVVDQLELLFLKDFLEVYPSAFQSNVIAPYSALIINPSLNYPSDPEWTSEQVSLLIFRAFELKQIETAHKWIKTMPFRPSSPSLLSLDSYLDWVITSCWTKSDEASKNDMVRSIFKALPLHLFQKYMTNKKYPELVSMGLVNRGFPLDEHCDYLLTDTAQGFKLSFKQLEDLLLRYRGKSLIVVQNILRYEQRYYNQFSDCWWLGVYYNEPPLIKAGAVVIRENSILLSDNDDILIKTPIAKIRKAASDSFPGTNNAFQIELIRQWKTFFG